VSPAQLIYTHALQVGMHFMNPVPVMPLVELIRGFATSDQVQHFAGHSSFKASQQFECKGISQAS
jgi:3-hydroxyacyl-CoA dehydrogenase